ncbi:MAG: ISAs1 family transposase [Oscillospiraceae bacterium]|nr:ISAs1 family transposase [Oscillospiraceae bacterium]
MNLFYHICWLWHVLVLCGVALEKDHGRIGSREYFLETDISWMPQRTEWDGLQGIGMVKSNVISTKTGEMREECRYFITSLTDIEAFASAVRSHWSIENQLHWQLDVAFREDSCRAAAITRRLT